MDNELSIVQVLELLQKVNLLEDTINRLVDEIKFLEEKKTKLADVRREFANAEQQKNIAEATYKEMTEKVADEVAKHPRTLNIAKIIQQKQNLSYIISQRDIAKRKYADAVSRYNISFIQLKGMIGQYGDINATIAEKKKDYEEAVTYYNSKVATFIAYSKFTPTLLDPREIKKVGRFPYPEQVSDESDFE